MSTYVPIQAITLSAAATTVSFTGIPQTFTDLIVVCFIKGDAANIGCALQFNGDTGSNYSATQVQVYGTTAASNRYSNQSSIFLTSQYASGTNEWTPVIWNIQNYSNTTTNKTVLGRYSRATNEVSAGSGLWRNTAAVNQMLFTATGDKFASGSQFTLYGIGSGAPKAFGGDIVKTDGTYWYHAFTKSGTFTPVQSLSADILVVAGGGGGGRANGGGGGAGGFRTATSQTLSGTYTVTVGGGGAGGTGSGSGTARGVSGENSSFGAVLVSTGGGGGGGNSLAGFNGGSGGGGGVAGSAFAAGNGNSGNYSPSEGNNGGTANSAPNYNAGGGGGAGAVGGNAGTNAGDGGIGSSTSISGGSVTGLGQLVSGTYYFAGGGGGGGNAGNNGSGGSGGGGTGLTGTNNGTSNTGGGGQGGGLSGGTYSNGGNGGSGIVIVRYAV